MGDILTQNEIDQLLHALSSGELDADEFKEDGAKSVKNYDFERPSKFSKEHLEHLKIFLNISDDCFRPICRATFAKM